MSRKIKPNGENSLNMLLFEPSSEWRVPNDFPDLSGSKIIGLDLETCDPNLERYGPGGIRGDGRVVGVSVAVDDGKWYFPFAHLSGGNMDQDSVVRYLRHLLSDSSRFVVGANLSYELEWLDNLGIEAKGRFCDIQVAEPLLDEEKIEGYSLEALTRQYLDIGKDETLLRQASDSYGINAKKELWKLHSKYVGPYAEFDAWAPLQIFKKQLKLLEEQGLLPIFELESKLLPIIFKMRKQGVPVDLEAADKLSTSLKIREDELRFSMKKKYNVDVDEWSGPIIARICEDLQIKYPRTEKGNPSFVGDWLENHDHPFLRSIADLRELNRLRTTFVKDWIFNYEHKGRVHPTWKQLASDEGGTRTGRMAASNPNPQQIPARSEFAHLIRALFIPEVGRHWAKLDYSQQEPRILTHFAYLCNFTGANLVRMAYHKNRDMDIYQFLAETCSMSRRDAKDATLGRCYGMGAKKFADKQGTSLDEADRKLRQFDESVPFVKEIADYSSRMAQKRGWIKTLLGRKRHFNYWEPCDSFEMRKQGLDTRPRRLAEAQAKWDGKRLQRADTRKALNSLIQGSAADMTKAAMHLIYEETGKVPYLAVHDELDFGVSNIEEADKIKKIMETCVEMTVPIKADLVYGKHWK